MIRLVKMGWKRIEKLAEPIHDALTQFNFDQDMYQKLMKDYQKEFEKTNDSQQSIRTVSCQWVRDNPDVGFSRHQRKAPIYIGG